MKKVLLTATLVAIFGFAANAQEQGDIRAGLGLGLGTAAKVDDSNGELKMGIGINAFGEYLITDVIGLAPGYTYFFDTKFNGGGKIGYGAFNIDGRYYFGDGDAQVYGLLGLGIISQRVSGGGFSASGSSTGLNIGAGVMYPMGDSMFLHGEAKYNTVSVGTGFNNETKNNILINLGVAFAFGG